MKKEYFVFLIIAFLLVFNYTVMAGNTFTYKNVVDYAEPVVINSELASFNNLLYKTKEEGAIPRIAYMPPATEFNYYIAIGEGIKAVAKQTNVDTFMLAPRVVQTSMDRWECFRM